MVFSLENLFLDTELRVKDPKTINITVSRKSLVHNSELKRRRF